MFYVIKNLRIYYSFPPVFFQFIPKSTNTIIQFVAQDLVLKSLIYFMFLANRK